MQFELNDEGKISQRTMRDVFVRILARSPSLAAETDPYVFFMVGCRLYERVMRGAGFDIDSINGIELIDLDELPPPTVVSLDPAPEAPAVGNDLTDLSTGASVPDLL